MERIPPRADTTLIHKVITELPLGIRKILGHVPFVLDADPGWIGLHFDREIGDGRYWHQTCHAIYGWGLTHKAMDQRETCVFLTKECATYRLYPRDSILHELGHILDERIGFHRPYFTPLDWYAQTNDYEAFATSFQAWATPAGMEGACYHHRDELWKTDRWDFEFFEKLARGN